MTDEERAREIAHKNSICTFARGSTTHSGDCAELYEALLSAFTSIRNEAIAEERERICDILMEEAREYAESDPESTDQMIASSLAKISSAIRFRSDPEKDSTKEKGPEGP